MSDGVCVEGRGAGLAMEDLGEETRIIGDTSGGNHDVESACG